MENSLTQVVLVKDIRPGDDSNYGYGRYIYNLTEFNGKLYFTAKNEENGYEPWVSDGTSSGTQLLLDINPDTGSSSARNFTELNGKLYFTAYDPENGAELWVSDGTTEGTQLLIDIYPGTGYYPNSYYPSAGGFTEFNGKLYFSARDEENGAELWVSDGTAAGTQLLVDINSGTNNYGDVRSSSPSNFIELDEKLYFTAYKQETGEELWVSDGTSEGTQLVADINPGSDSSLGDSIPANYFVTLNRKLYFTAYNEETGIELWVSDGTTEGTQLVADINPGSDSSLGYNFYNSGFTELNGKLYFRADDGENGRELWVSDGTSSGTQLLLDIYPGSNIYGYANSSKARYFTEFNGKLYFSADDRRNGSELWVSDGTTDGTQLLADINPGKNNSGDGDNSYPRYFTEFDEKLYFSAGDEEIGRELWVSDGTSEGTQLVADINPGKRDYYTYAHNSDPNRFTELNGKFYFSADDGENGRELWVSDGTTDGTQLLADINLFESNDGSNPGDFTEFNGKLYFVANDGENGYELWVSDGTTDGTQLLADINPGSSSDARYFTELNGKLYFTAKDEETGNELWVTDGTTDGTQLLADINPGSDEYGDPNSSYARYFTEFDGKLYFTAKDEETGNELWVSDGTTDGTQLLIDINLSTNQYGDADGSYAGNFTEFNGKLYFRADDGVNGNELWVSDGTAAGTQLVKDINPGSDSDGNADSSFPESFTEFNGKLYFNADDGENGRELWVSDGTSEGTQLLADINPGSDEYGDANDSSPGYLTEFKGKLYFNAYDEETGSELWVSDGTSEGTQLFVDINPGTGDNGFANVSYPSDLSVIDNKLYFNADDGENGRELWVSDGTSEGTQLVADINPGSSKFNYSYSFFGYDSSPRYFTVVGEELFFTADNGESGTELFKLFVEEPEMIIGTDDGDNLVGTDKIDLIEGLEGNDTLYGGASNDTIIGGCGRDSLFGAVGDDSLIGDNGNDTLDGGGGNDTIVGGCGKDSLFGATGDDSLIGGHGKDTLYGDMGNDTIVGGSGRDSLSGATGDDSLVGENGNDTLDGGAGDDTLTGGTGRDIFILGINRGFDTITDFNLEGDRIGLVEDLEFENLTFSGSAILVGSETLATLDGVNTQELSENIFEQFELE